MRTARMFMRGLTLIIISMLVIAPGIPAQDSGGPDAAAGFGKEELAQMLAPIALYPDSLIAQILMAATYPLEVIEAERWLRQNPALKGEALDNALKEMSWDASVQSLCHIPDVLFAMSDRLDQTRKLGDAYLAQQDEVMATIQELRRKAGEQGNLKTTQQQTVVNEDPYIRIEPADPQVVYVPVYDPAYVYGPWWYPAYPPWYWYYPPGGFISGGYIGFGAGFYFGFGLFSWCWFDWHGHGVYVDYDQARHFHHHHNGDHDSGKHHWQHDPTHRQGVAYRDNRTSERFGQRPGQRPRTGPEVRGYSSRGDRQGAAGGPGGSLERRDVTPVPGGEMQRQGSRQQLEPRQRPASPQVSPEGGPGRGAGRETPFIGVGSGNFERRAGERGGESRRSIEPRYQGGGRGPQPSGGSFQRGGQGGSPSGGVRQGAAPGGGGSRQSVAPGGGGRQGGSPGGGRQGGSPGGIRR